MDGNSKLTMLKERFENRETGQQVDGITIMIDGKFKEVFDVILNKSDDYNDYTEVLKDSILLGINEIINNIK
ncbi:hypothetical protein [Wukongibacter sp. M2B1]|uniref:hypothetical protein n=1 Tax=Wukongibacter sp. M2B1 TaxID=3088895 RepID=UPI003D7968CC